MRKNAHYWATPASVLAILLLAALSGHCFCSPVGHGDDLPVSGAASSNAGSQRQCDLLEEVTCATGPFSSFRFSTKAQDEETDLLYYGYRYYNASGGRWLSRDPLGESGFDLPRNVTKRKPGDCNDYLFVRNDPLRLFDVYGLSVADVANYYWAFMKELEQLCICHLIRPEWGWMQNCASCWGCTRQTENLEDVLDRVKTEDPFQITVYYRPNPCWPLFHNSVRIEPSNSEDPVIDADTWKGCFSVTWPKGSSQTDFKRCFTCNELLHR